MVSVALVPKGTCFKWLMASFIFGSHSLSSYGSMKCNHLVAYKPVIWPHQYLTGLMCYAVQSKILLAPEMWKETADIDGKWKWLKDASVLISSISKLQYFQSLADGQERG